MTSAAYASPRVVVDDADFLLYEGDALAVVGQLSHVFAVVTSPPYLDRRPEYGHPTDEWWHEFFALAETRVSGPILLNVGRIWRDNTEQLWWLDLVAAAKASNWKHYDTLVWVKPNSNPIHGAVFADRHEYVLCLGQPRCEFNTDAIRVPYADSSIGRMKRGWVSHVGVKGDSSRRSPRKSEPHPEGGRPPSYVTVPTGREKGNPHPAPMPERLAEHLVQLAVPVGQSVFDPFGGSGTTAIACRRLGRRCVMAEISPEYAALAAARLSQQALGVVA